MFDDITTLSDREFSEAISVLPNDRGLQLMNKDARGFIKMRNLTPDRLQELSCDRTKFHVVCMTVRNISQPFWSHLEETYFPPETPANDDIQVAFYRWQDMLWDFVTVPLWRVSTCYASASHVNCRLANGVPTMLSFEGKRGHGAMRGPLEGADIISFPLSSRRVFTLEPLHAQKGPVLAGLAAFSPAPEAQPPTLIDELIQKFRRE